MKFTSRAASLLKGLGALCLAAYLPLTSCKDDVSSIGGSLTSGEVTIVMDSIYTDIQAKPVLSESIDGRSITKLVGRINVPEYGRLECAFVTQMMSATKMPVPDSITEQHVDSMRLVFSVPRGSLTGDSLAPQQLSVYRLTKQLPSGIQSDFDPSGYYDSSSPWAKRSYTLSVIARGDSAVQKQAYVKIPMMLPKDFALDIFRKYRAEDKIFQWPSSFNNFFPGIYVDQTFGNGCVANVSKAEIFLYWNRMVRSYEPTDEKDEEGNTKYEYVDRVKRDSICLFASQPEVLSSNIIRYEMADRLRKMAEEGQAVITTPGGYTVEMDFPALELLDKYAGDKGGMAVVSSLTFEIPATQVKNDYGLTVAPYLLMVKSSEKEKFFGENKVPDQITSFYAAYNSETGSYQFNSMRQYFLNLYADYKSGKPIDPEDMRFELVPVGITTEVVEGYTNSTTYVTKCTPFVGRPTMTLLNLSKSLICFTFSSQKID